MDSHDVIILGGGLVGLTLALALDAHGLTSAVVDPADLDKTRHPGFDGRVSAIASGPWRMLEAIGLNLASHGCPIDSIETREGNDAPPLIFATGPDEEPLGTMVENRVLRTVLLDAVMAAKDITLHALARATAIERTGQGVTVLLSSRAVLKAPLLLVAEGRNSETRAAAGIKIAHWRYRHTAMVTALDHSIPHNNVAHEIFFPAGPFALLPMQPGTRSALVWTVSEKDSVGMRALSDRAFLAEAEKRAGGLLGELTLSAPRSSYPLGFHHAGQIIAERLALVGDAAHGIHPIAGQGLNLGFRDVATLVEVLVEGARLGLDLGDSQLLSRYERWRGLDTFMVALATDGLTRLFGLPGKPASRLRKFGLGLVGQIPPLKARFMAEARGESGDLPKLLQGLSI